MISSNSNQGKLHDVLKILLADYFKSISHAGYCQGPGLVAMLNMLAGDEEVKQFNEVQKLIFSYLEKSEEKGKENATNSDQFQQAAAFFAGIPQDVMQSFFPQGEAKEAMTTAVAENFIIEEAGNLITNDILSVRKKIIGWSNETENKEQMHEKMLTLTEDERNLLKIEPFLNESAIAYDAENFPSLFNNKPVGTQSINMALSLITPDKLRSKNKDSKEEVKDNLAEQPVIEAMRFSGVYSKEQLTQLMSVIVEIFKKPFGLAFVSGDHFVSGGFKPSEEKLSDHSSHEHHNNSFSFYDINAGYIVSDEYNPEGMSNAIFDSFKNTERAGFATRFFCLQQDLPEFKNAIKLLKNTEAFQKIHLIDDQNVNDTDDKNSISRLYLAARDGDVELAKELLSHKASIDSKDNDGMTPAYIATQNGNIEIVKLLLTNNASVDSPTNDNFTPLHIAARKGNLEMVHLLLQYSANPNAQNNDGLTPLHLAAKFGHLDIVGELLNHKPEPDLSLRNKYGQTAFRMAEDNHHEEIINVFKEIPAPIISTYAEEATFKSIAQSITSSMGSYFRKPYINPYFEELKTAIEPELKEELSQILPSNSFDTKEAELDRKVQASPSIFTANSTFTPTLFPIPKQSLGDIKLNPHQKDSRIFLEKVNDWIKSADINGEEKPCINLLAQQIQYAINETKQTGQVDLDFVKEAVETAKSVLKFIKVKENSRSMLLVNQIHTDLDQHIISNKKTSP